MKILVAIESTKRAEEMAHTTLRWAGRAGFDLRVFIPDNRQRKVYERFVDDYNYHYYGFLEPEQVVVAKSKEGKPSQYAKAHGYDLLVLLPDNLLDYHTIQDDDKSFIEYAEDVGKARAEFSLKPDLNEMPLARNSECWMKRVL